MVSMNVACLSSSDLSIASKVGQPQRKSVTGEPLLVWEGEGTLMYFYISWFRHGFDVRLVEAQKITH